MNDIIKDFAFIGVGQAGGNIAELFERKTSELRQTRHRKIYLHGI